MSKATERSERSGWTVRLRTAVFVAVPACLLAILLAHPGCSDECEHSSDCQPGYVCSSGDCVPYGADADADGEADGLPEATDEGGADGDEDVAGPDGDADGDAADGEAETVECGPLDWCGGPDCVDFLTDEAHCGNCDTPCDAGDICVGGGCLLECAGSGLSCNDECVDQLSDPDNCGACDEICTDPQVCAAGDCVSVCPSGTTDCSRACADLMSNVDHCGTCDHGCGNLEWCVSGVCLPNPCALGDLFCDGSCVPQDVNNCGDCGVVCDTGFLCCNRLFATGMICANAQSDPLYCGNCTTMCGAGESCVEGVCTGP